EGNLLRLQQALYHAPDLYDRIPIGGGPGRGRHYHIADAQSTFLIMQDSTRHWTLHAVVDEAGDMTAQFERTIGIPVPFTVLHVGEWKQNLLLADHYGAGRVFLAGDAVHLMVPTGGLGMNTGVGDAIGDGYTLLRLGGSSADTSGVERALRARHAPFDVLTIDRDAPRDVYGYDLILVRPDLHVVWRGNTGPSDPAQLAAVATGQAQ